MGTDHPASDKSHGVNAQAVIPISDHIFKRCDTFQGGSVAAFIT